MKGIVKTLIKFCKILHLIKLLIEETTTNRNVYNGKLKVYSNQKIITNLRAVIECIK